MQRPAQDLGAPTILLPAAIEVLDGQGLRRVLANVTARGFRNVIVETEQFSDSVLDAVSGAGLDLYAGITCFHTHGAVSFDDERVVRPVGADGLVQEAIGWYEGLVPTDTYVRDELLERTDALLRVDQVRGVVLDFIRWPIHWEEECFGPAEQRPARSFDPTTLADFTRTTGISLPEGAGEAAQTLLTTHADQWFAYRALRVTEVVRAVGERARATGKTAGAFVVPLNTHDRYRLAGQDLAGWTEDLDVVYPMVYTELLGQPPHWAAEVTAEARRLFPERVVPLIGLDDYIAGAPASGAARDCAVFAGSAYLSVLDPPSSREEPE